ncbi:hypothetical protein WG901_19765 [Novosphingobium sp. PS1R-30]|uniref:Uncharacterized protein n=1 Tax=Novosphingobium anseongense TaxID=3133436 RepID=A0ABU8S0M9_9SPHN
MACCILATLLLAHIVALLRRWGMFWGIVQVPADVEFDTAYARLRRWLALPRVRLAVAALLVVEMAAFGSWLYVAHGNHLYRIGDQAIGQLRGQTIVYADVCGSKGTRSVRLVLRGDDRPMRILT